MILRLDTDVKDLVLAHLGIVEDNVLRSAAICGAKRRIKHRWLEVGQIRVARHIQVDVGVTMTGRRQVRRHESDERDVFAEALLVYIVIRRRITWRGTGLIRLLRRRVGEGVKMPLLGDATAIGEHGVGRVVTLGQGRVGADTLVEHRHAVGQRGNGRQLDLLRFVRFYTECIPDLRVCTRHHERKVLHDINVIGRLLGVVKRRQRIDINTARVNGDAVLLLGWFLNKDVFDIIDHVVCCTHRTVYGRTYVVAVIYLLGLRILVIWIIWII